MQTFHPVTHKFVKGFGITRPTTKKQSTELFLGGLLLLLVLGGLAL